MNQGYGSINCLYYLKIYIAVHQNVPLLSSVHLGFMQ